MAPPSGRHKRRTETGVLNYNTSAKTLIARLNSTLTFHNATHHHSLDSSMDWIGLDWVRSLLW